MATHSLVIAGEFPRTEEPGRLQSMGSQRVDATNTHKVLLEAAFTENLLNAELY